MTWPTLVNRSARRRVYALVTQLSRRSVLLGIGAVGAFLAVDLGAVAYANRWIGAGNGLTPSTFMEGFRAVFGLHPGFRRNHAKGVAVAGYFESNGNGAELSKAAVFAPGRTPVVGRFSLSGGHPGMADTPGATRSLALAFALLRRHATADGDARSFLCYRITHRRASTTGSLPPRSSLQPVSPIPRR